MPHLEHLSEEELVALALVVGDPGRVSMSAMRVAVSQLFPRLPRSRFYTDDQGQSKYITVWMTLEIFSQYRAWYV